MAYSSQRTGLCAAMGFEKRPPGTAADRKTSHKKMVLIQNFEFLQIVKSKRQFLL